MVGENEIKRTIRDKRMSLCTCNVQVTYGEGAIMYSKILYKIDLTALHEKQLKGSKIEKVKKFSVSTRQLKVVETDRKSTR